MSLLHVPHYSWSLARIGTGGRQQMKWGDGERRTRTFLSLNWIPLPKMPKSLQSKDWTWQPFDKMSKETEDKFLPFILELRNVLSSSPLWSNFLDLTSEMIRGSGSLWLNIILSLYMLHLLLPAHNNVECFADNGGKFQVCNLHYTSCVAYDIIAHLTTQVGHLSLHDNQLCATV